MWNLAKQDAMKRRDGNNKKNGETSDETAIGSMQSPHPHHLRQSLCILGHPPTRDSDDHADDSPWDGALASRAVPGLCPVPGQLSLRWHWLLELGTASTMVPGLVPAGTRRSPLRSDTSSGRAASPGDFFPWSSAPLGTRERVQPQRERRDARGNVISFYWTRLLRLRCFCRCFWTTPPW